MGNHFPNDNDKWEIISQTTMTNGKLSAKTVCQN